MVKRHSGNQNPITKLGRSDMSYSDIGRFWKYYLDRASRTIESFANINKTCEDTIESMILIYSEIFKTVETTWGKRKLPNAQVFVLIYYQRNIVYLQSSHLLACIGFINPSANLNRTVCESLQRGYLFTVQAEEADEYYQAIEKEKEDLYFRQKGPSYIRRKIYLPETEKQEKDFYGQLCISAHADVKGAGRDYPQYLPDRIKDDLSVILSLMYGNIQMMAECFFNFLNPNAKKLIKQSMERIATALKSVPLFEPDANIYSSRIRLKHGNFMGVL